MANNKKHDVLPSPKSPDFIGGRVYTHFMLPPGIVERLKQTAFSRGYKPANFLEELLDSVLPKRINRRITKRLPARISLVRTKEAR